MPTKEGQRQIPVPIKWAYALELVPPVLIGIAVILHNVYAYLLLLPLLVWWYEDVSREVFCSLKAFLPIS